MPAGFPDYYGGLTLPVTVPEGGTGQTSLTDHGVLVGAGTSGVVIVPLGNVGDVLQVTAAGADPSFAPLSGSQTFSSVAIAPYAAAAFRAGAASDMGSLSAAIEVALPTGSTVDPLIVAKSGASLLTLDYNGALSIAGALSLGTPLAIAQGGTGTATPALVAGTGISITGSWPGQTVTNSSAYATLPSPLPIAHGGTGTATPALVAGSNIGLSGTWPNQTVAVVASPTFTNMIAATLSLTATSSTLAMGSAGTALDSAIIMANASANAGSTKQTKIGTGADTVGGIARSLFGVADNGVAWLLALDTAGNLGIGGALHLGTPLATAYGGTGTATPALVAGSNITISGGWPGQTVAVVDSPTFTDVSAAGLSLTGTGPSLSIGTPGSADSAAIFMANASTNTGAAQKTQIGPGGGAVAGVDGSLLGIGDSNVGWKVGIDTSGNLGIAGALSLGTPLATAQGGTGSTSLDAALIVHSAIVADIPGATSSVSNAPLLSGSPAGLMRVTVEIVVTSTAGSSTAQFNLKWTEKGVALSDNSFSVSYSGANFGRGSHTFVLYNDASASMTWDLTWSPYASGSPSYDVHVRLEKLY